MRKTTPPEAETPETQTSAIDRELKELLATIESEEVPDRLLDLAHQLQAALRAQAKARD